MNSTMLYPGMCDDGLEIFLHDEEKQLKAIDCGKVILFADLPASKTKFLDAIIESEPETKEVLESFFPGDHKAQKEKLAECRFGGLNFSPDVSGDSVSPDFIDCPIRATCAGCGIVCKNFLEFKGEIIDMTEIAAMKLLSTSMKNFAVQSTLKMCEGTYNVFKTKLYKKLKIYTKQELTRVGVFLGVN